MIFGSYENFKICFQDQLTFTIEVHEEKKPEYYPVSCAMCNKPFSSSYDVKKHIEAVHDFLRCGTCNANFKKESQIKRHILQKHEGKGTIIKTNDMTYKKYDLSNRDLKSVQGNEMNNMSKEVHEVKNSVQVNLCQKLFFLQNMGRICVYKNCS